MAKFRFQCGGLDESMRTVVEVANIQELKTVLQKDDLIPERFLKDLVIESYRFDSRIGWDTHIVILPNYGVAGFTDGPLL